ncbi:MAG: hypothetical protein A3H42_04135 [Deltaproteobacteria bacterium RIFCSPLOWO2_02_FULL_46_8]|nr:MAG: hypothetical protein A3H42_04135 [Deltaproteobacteria bacterium RIFCSPLOWO2_02_FULL_46_8]
MAKVEANRDFEVFVRALATYQPSAGGLRVVEAAARKVGLSIGDIKGAAGGLRAVEQSRAGTIGSTRFLSIAPKLYPDRADLFSSFLLQLQQRGMTAEAQNIAGIWFNRIAGDIIK